jgi:hypothetical protein
MQLKMKPKLLKKNRKKRMQKNKRKREELTGIKDIHARDRAA